MVDKSLSNVEIARLLNINVMDIIPYSKLSLYSNITELLSAPYSFKIILLQESQGKGHWVVLLRQNNKYFYFNSYGKAYDTDMNSISRLARKILGEDTPKIKNLLGNTKMSHNTIEIQGDESNTCGRYVVYMVKQCIYNKVPFNKAIKQLQRDGKPTPDDYILNHT